MKTIELTDEQYEAIERVLSDLAEEQHYGHFNGGDPRDFEPDPECSTEEEREAHRRDCAAMEAGGQALMPPTGEWHRTENAVIHFHRQAYGLGVNTYRDPEAAKLLAAFRGQQELLKEPTR